MSANPRRERRRAAARPRPARLPRLRRRRPAARHDDERGDARARRAAARRDRAQPDTRSACSAPTRPRRTGSRRVFEATDRAWAAEILPDRRAPRARGPRARGALGAPLPGLARGLPADRPARPLQLLRGVHPHRRLDVQPAREVAEGRRARSRGGGRSRRSTTCSARTSGGRTTTASRTRIPGFIDHVVNKKAEVIRVYLPPDANCLLSVADHCLRSRDYVNVIVAGKQPALELPRRWTRRSLHCTRGAGIWEWASNDEGAEPDVVMACCGDVPDARDARRRRAPARAPARAEGARRQRRRPDAAPARERASARALRPRVRRALHHRRGR